MDKKERTLYCYSYCNKKENKYKIEYRKGEIKAKLTLKEKKPGIWKLIIISEKDDKHHVNLTGHLGMVLYMMDLFKTIYDLDIFRINKKKEEKKSW